MVLAFVACAGNGPADDVVVVVDAGPDAVAACPIGLVQRDFECKAICFHEYARCPGQVGADCYDECLRFEVGTYYCPER